MVESIISWIDSTDVPTGINEGGEELFAPHLWNVRMEYTLSIRVPISEINAHEEPCHQYDCHIHPDSKTYDDSTMPALFANRIKSALFANRIMSALFKIKIMSAFLMYCTVGDPSVHYHHCCPHYPPWQWQWVKNLCIASGNSTK